MQLVSFLASGVNGAEGGSATFVLRGTASSAASVLYNDFEATAQPGTNIITLDANGAAEVYCNAYCDVTLKTSAGATLRTVTIGNAATCVEVVSDSFTGTSYTGSPTAVSQPITLASVLDKWDNSAGADDWKVAVGGVATNLSSAFSALAGLFFNVKDPAYGAVGDGVTDDTTPITLAITAAAAAGGGIVFFPASTSFYKYTTISITSSNITLMGAGPRASVLKSASTSANIVASAALTDDWIRFIGLSFTNTGAGASPILQVGSGINILVDNCEFIGATLTGTCIRKTSTAVKTFVNILNSKVTVGATCTRMFDNAADDGACIFKLTDCRFVYTVGFVGRFISGPDFYVRGCTFDASAVVGVYTGIVCQSNTTAGKHLGRFIGNKFLDGGSGCTLFDLSLIATGADFYEEGNEFSGFTATTSAATADGIYAISHNAEDAYRIFLGSRKGRTIELTQSSTGTIVLNAFCSYENVFINYTAAGNLTIQAPISVMTNGAVCNLVLQNNNASQRDIVVDYGESVQTYGPQAATSGSDLTLQPQNTERVVLSMRFMHFGSGAPLAFIPVPVED